MSGPIDWIETLGREIRKGTRKKEQPKDALMLALDKLTASRLEGKLRVLLIDFIVAAKVRNQQEWRPLIMPDLSDIYDETIEKIKDLFLEELAKDDSRRGRHAADSVTAPWTEVEHKSEGGVVRVGSAGVPMYSGKESRATLQPDTGVARPVGVFAPESKEHFPMPINADGDGPETDIDKVVGMICSCGWDYCMKWAK